MVLILIEYINLYKIIRVEKIILSNKSTIEELDKSIIDLKKYEDEFDCVNKDSNKDKYYNFCSAALDYYNYGKAKIMYQKLNENYSYSEYKEMYLYFSDLGSLEKKQTVLEKKEEIDSVVYNYFVDKIINNEAESINELLEELSGMETVETGSSGCYYCTSYLDDDMANIYNFSMAQVDAKYKYFYYRNSIDYKSDKDYMKVIIDYLVENLKGSENPFNKHPNQTNEAQEIRNELLKKSFSPRKTRYECKVLENNYNLSNSAPEIGMTKAEVLRSAWGNPRKKNKTTTKYGISEQWVYVNFRYVYFDEDEIVTSIQD